MDTPRSQSKQNIAQVEQALADAKAKWSGWGVSIGSYFGTPQDQVLGALSQIGSLGVEPWVSRAGKLAASDQAGWNAWVKTGTELLHNIQTTAQDAATGTLTAIVAETVKATAKTVKRGAVKAAKATVAVVESVWDFRYWAVIGLVVAAAGVAAWKLGLLR